MELLVFGHAGARVLVFPTRYGRFHEYEDFGLVNALAEPLEKGLLQLFCVDSIDGESLYNRYSHPHDRIRRHNQYEQYIIHEVLPFSRLQNPQPFMIAHGCSLGAFHAMNIAMRHPQWFGKVVALSGRYDLSVPVAEFRSLFDDYYNEDIYFHTPNHFLPNLDNEGLLNLLRRMEITIAIGAEDPFLNNNRALCNVLSSKGIQHNFYIWDGRAHHPAQWQKMVPFYV
ncbi:esterase family protein [Nibrella viscosa]|uniref:Esterase family protein n=1 Tax=Nibrella viscosa TaxID=1084524 RepID=A0ABP8JWN3_9BACT